MIFSALKVFMNSFPASGRLGRLGAGEGVEEAFDRVRVAGHGDVCGLYRFLQAALLWKNRPFAEALHAGDLALDGSPDLAERFMGLFPLPEQAALSPR